MKKKKPKWGVLKISKRQFDKMRIMYAVGLAVDSALTPKLLFEEGVNPKWLKNFDSLGFKLDEFKRKGGIALTPWQMDELKENGKLQFGLFDIRVTKSGCVINAGIRLRGKLR